MKYFFLSASLIFIFSNCFDGSATKKTEAVSVQTDYLEEGRKIAMMTFATLSENLQTAMERGGVPEAVAYCNLAASSLVDSLDQVYQVEIKRTSMRVRNPQNRPTIEEGKQLRSYQEQADAGKELKALMRQSGKDVIFHAPIFVMPLCQKCHGKIGEELKKEDYEVIHRLYPEDEAVDYYTGDLRGMWSISFKGK